MAGAGTIPRGDHPGAHQDHSTGGAWSGDPRARTPSPKAPCRGPRGQRDLAASLTQSGVADGLRERQSQRLWRSKVRSGKTAELSAVASEVEVKRRFWPSNREISTARAS